MTCHYSHNRCLRCHQPRHYSIGTALPGRYLNSSALVIQLHMSRLTKALELPHQVDLARASFAAIVTMDELAEVGQLCGDTKSRRDHNDRLILSHSYTSSMGSAEQ